MRFRRREPLHERLAREGGLTFRPRPVDTHPRWGEVGIHGVARPREWDAVVTVDAPELGGDDARFVALEDGTLLIEEAADEELDVLADALASAVDPPYRAAAHRQDGATWAVGARRLEVVRIVEEVAGDELALTVSEGRRDLLVDGARGFGSLASLERWAGERWESYAVSAQRLDGDLWEVRAAPL